MQHPGFWCPDVRTLRAMTAWGRRMAGALQVPHATAGRGVGGGYVTIHMHQHTIKFYSINSIFQVLSPLAQHARVRACTRVHEPNIGGELVHEPNIIFKLGAVLVTTPDLQPSRLGYLTIFRVSPGRHNACMHAPPHSGRWHSSVGYSQPRVHEVSTAADLDGRPQWFPAGVGRSEFFSDPPSSPDGMRRAGWACIARA